ncbi:serine/threonine protein kinase, partial [Akkermansiaceae bacterium]|nr:serine/threonine protein kinase [Akkermansiaceae bacterium]
MSEEPEIPTSFVAPSIEELSPLFPAYEIEAFIAQGGMGAVYKATQKSLDRAVAIKILPREFGEDAQFRSSFEAEAKAMARLNHPNLIGVYDFGDVDGMLFIIMEYVQGKALYYSIHKKAIDPTIALDLISKISRGLGHAHKGGILHRDIKPANILLDIDAEPKVGDFGLARPMDAKRGEGLAFGTPGYTAPEVYSSKDEPIDQRSDIFSVGAILFELVKGRAPEHGATSMKTGFDPRLDAILSKATHADPNQRFSNVEDFANQLDALAPKLSGPRFATATSPTSSLPPAPITELRSSKSSSLPAVAAVALILAGAGFAFYQSQ